MFSNQKSSQPPSEKSSTSGKSVSLSVISHDLSIVGDLKTDGEIQIDGKIEGNVSASTVTIAKSGMVQGEIKAEEVVVHGKVAGQVIATRVELAATAEVDGDIENESLTLEEGASFTGRVSRKASSVAPLRPAKDNAAGDQPTTKASA